jgi:hypothetical protein
MPNYNYRQSHPRPLDKKGVNYYQHEVKESKEYNFTFIPVNKGSEVIGFINKMSNESLDAIDYYGHAGPDAMMLDFDGESKDYLNLDSWKNLNTKKFSPLFAFYSYGCFQGQSGGLMNNLALLWNVKTLGSDDFTLYYKMLTPWKPASKGKYIEYDGNGD